ncbi:MAG TPA: hypothetical protein VEK84_17440 [Terriglobales bacterium]|nr:hypothetical protein [Terriglobales bacterium]
MRQRSYQFSGRCGGKGKDGMTDETPESPVTDRELTRISEAYGEAG